MYAGCIGCCACVSVQSLGDVIATIHDLEASIIRQLEEKVLEFEEPLQRCSHAVAQLDVLMSFAEVSQDYNYVRPTVVADAVMYVKQARHPLQELTVDTYIPNDVAVSELTTR